MYIENAIYAGDFALIKFRGDFEFDLKKSKLEFNFDQIAILGFNINLKKDEAAKVRHLNVQLKMLNLVRLDARIMVSVLMHIYSFNSIFADWSVYRVGI